MRRVTTLAAVLAATAILPLAATAQQTTPPMNEPMGEEQPMQQEPMEQMDQPLDQTMDQAGTTPAAPAVLQGQEQDQVLSDSYIGADVVARSDEGLEAVGQVSELLLDGQDKIIGVVVDVGGFLGVGAKPVGLAWTSLTEERSEEGLLLKTSLTRQDLEDAPEFKTLEDQQVESDQQMMEQTTPPAPAQ